MEKAHTSSQQNQQDLIASIEQYKIQVKKISNL